MDTNQLKQQAHEEFTKQFIDTYKVWNCYDDKKSPELEKEHLDFIDSIIDKTVQHERERIVDKLKYDLFPAQVREENPRYWQGYTDTLKKVLSLITNNSDINK